MRNEATIRAILEHAAASPENDLDRMLGDYYASGMDVESIEAAGTAAIRPYLDAIDSVTTHEDLWALLPSFHRDGLQAPFGWAVTLDHDDASRNLLWLAPAGLGLPDRESYFQEGDAPAALRRGIRGARRSAVGQPRFATVGAGPGSARLRDHAGRAAHEGGGTPRPRPHAQSPRHGAIDGARGGARPARLPPVDRGRRGDHCQCAAAAVLRGPARHRRRDTRRRAPRLPHLPGRPRDGRRAARGVRRRGLQLLRTAHPGSATAARAIQADHQRHRWGHG